MRELSLFSGAGGGLLGTKLLGWKHCGYVEYNEYCQKVIAQRIKDGFLDEAPIFGDIRAFIDQGYAASYRGMVDVVTAGFPCQPFSVAGKGLAEDDERNMWPQTIAVVRQVRPRYALLENVPGLLAYPYYGTILGDLAEAGYSAKWLCMGADDLGAIHRRKRLFIIAHSDSDEIRCDDERQRIPKRASKGRLIPLNRIERFSTDASDAESVRRNEDKIPANSNTQCQRKPYETWGPFRVIPCPDPSGRLWGFADSDIHRRFDGMADWVDRIAAIGNGQVPIVVKTVWELMGPEV